MKIALVSDIHGNLLALEALLADLGRERPDQVVCLGDLATDGPRPREVIRSVRALGWPTVAGNTDTWLLGPQPFADGSEEKRAWRTPSAGTSPDSRWIWAA
ncbi:putative phosphodiesterase [Deinobacterium chartae]|uniref:Putative phosphodiesterase n=1 Tax=Deinobacterium chartae TaxID=521158 RepID=A0A841HYC1_9DEIO|nr:metallophosphoesterase family protein [Deinobacterium chartae]MBB6098397.1 putative phosphodiesterase [Deinobacterium chartae]